MTLVPNGRTVRRMRAWATLAILVAASACGRPQYGIGRVVPHAPADSLELTLILIGDAGLPNPEGEPVLQALERELERDPERTVVAFLGDNIYPVGLEDTTTERGQVGLGILRAQLAPLFRTGARAVFVPGNHDWAAGDLTGWNDIVRQERFLNDVGGGQVVMEPRDGCPGPVVMDVDRLLRLIALDTHWWLHTGPKPGPDRCSPGRRRAWSIPSGRRSPRPVRAARWSSPITPSSPGGTTGATSTGQRTCSPSIRGRGSAASSRIRTSRGARTAT
jgi:hypothetical protein